MVYQKRGLKLHKKTIKKGEGGYSYNIESKFKKNKKTGFHNLINASDINPTFTQTICIILTLYKNLLVDFNLTKLRSHNLVIASDLKSEVLHRHLGSNSSLMMDIPHPASKELEKKR